MSDFYDARLDDRDVIPFPCKLCVDDRDTIIRDPSRQTGIIPAIFEGHMKIQHGYTWMNDQDRIKRFMEQRRSVRGEFYTNLKEAVR